MTPKEYVEKLGAVCPNCGSFYITQNRMESDGDIAWCEVECEACGATWTDQLKLIGYSNLKLKEPT